MKLSDFRIGSLFSGDRPDTAASLGAALLCGLLLLFFSLVLPQFLKDLSRHHLPESSSKISVTGRLEILTAPSEAGSGDPAAAPEALSSQSSPASPLPSSSRASSKSPAKEPVPAPQPRPATPSRPRKESGSAAAPRRERQAETVPRSAKPDKKKNGSGSPEKSVTSDSGSPASAAPEASSREPLRQDAGRAAREGHLKGAGLIRREIERLKRYPPRALRNGIEGSGAILAEVSASGRVSGARVSKKTGNRFLDGSLEETAAGIIGFDTGIPGEPYRTEIPVRYLISPR